jgi:DNA repair exonuclease SbcCD ATPase subunit
MKLQYVEISGFRGFREMARFDMPSGFTVLNGHNGTGKSTVLDAIEFAITGTIAKYAVREARGGGLDEHIWWVGEREARDYYVTVGFVDGDAGEFRITRSRSRGCDAEPAEILNYFSRQGAHVQPSLETVVQTTLIRDELIATLSLDLPEQQRFTAVRTAIGSLAGPDYSERTSAILAAANASKSRQADRIKESQSELGRSLGGLTEARSIAERSSDISEALQIVGASGLAPSGDISERSVALRRHIATKKASLREIETARLLAVELLPRIKYLDSPDGQSEMGAAQAARENARTESAKAQEQLAAAIKVEAAEKATDEYVTHLAAIVEHGTALGLQQGHCPLCDAGRSHDEFERALIASRNKLAERGRVLEEVSSSLASSRIAAAAADQSLAEAERHLRDLENRRDEAQKGFRQIEEIYRRNEFNAPASDPEQAQAMLFSEQENLIRLERALSVLENSNAVERVTSLEQRVARLRELADQEAARLANAQKAVESARLIDAAARTVRNEILTEQFDTVMPLLKELYRRLRPHSDWTEIESDFGGKIRASLNFTVGDGYNPQFLFSSGQRRATGLAFLLAVHLSRPWCTWSSLLLDDPVQHIDDYRALNLVEVLSAIRRTGRQIIVAVEDAALADLLGRRLRGMTSEPGRYFELHTSDTGSAEVAAIKDINPMPRLVLRPARVS